MESASRRRYSVLLISHTYPPVLGGSEIEAQRVAKALIGRGHQVKILCTGGPPMPTQANWADPNGVPVQMFGSSLSRWRDHVFAAGITQAILRERATVDVLYFLMQGLQLVTGIPLARSLGIPVVMKFSSTGIIPHLRRSRLGRLELNLLKRWAHKVMILNPAMEQEALDFGFHPGQLLWMPNPVDIEEFAPVREHVRLALRAELGLPPDACVVLFVGRLAPEKLLPSLIRAFGSLVSRHPECILAVVGDGAERQALESLASHHGGGAIRFVGRIPVDSVRSWMQASDIFTLVSEREGLPCSLIEAMSVGLPSVVSDLPATRQLVRSGQEGFLFDAGDERALSERLSQLIEDSDLRRRFGIAARSAIGERYSTERVASRYEALFAEVTKR